MTPHGWYKTYYDAGQLRVVHSGWSCERCGWHLTTVGSPDSPEEMEPKPTTDDPSWDCDYEIARKVLTM